MGDPFFVAAAALSAVAALLHVGCIAFGSAWCRDADVSTTILFRTQGAGTGRRPVLAA